MVCDLVCTCGFMLVCQGRLLRALLYHSLCVAAEWIETGTASSYSETVTVMALSQFCLLRMTGSHSSAATQLQKALFLGPGKACD